MAVDDPFFKTQIQVCFCVYKRNDKRYNRIAWVNSILLNKTRCTI